MQKVLPFRRIAEVAPYMDLKVLDYINEGQIETFESYEEFNILAFDWYDISSEKTDNPQIMIYLDREDLFFFCEDSDAEKKVQEIIKEETKSGGLENEQLLYRFFVRLLKDDMRHLDELESAITETENEVIAGSDRGYLDQIIDFRKELLRLKRYYEQLDAIFDGTTENVNELLSDSCIRRFVILGSRVGRYLRSTLNLRDYVAQMREAYQAQIDIQQNDLMKIFTVVTAIFLPLTLLVGWYGMNFPMPELEWTYGYPTVIVMSAVIVIVLIFIFKKRKWF